MTPAQCRAARALLAITQQRLADMADVSLHTITDFEMEQRQISEGLVHTIEVALEAVTCLRTFIQPRLESQRLIRPRA